MKSAYHSWCGAFCAITPYQLRMARAALSWSRAELARRSGVSVSTVQRLERLSSEPRNHFVSSMVEVIACLKERGVTFLPEKAGCAAGIRFQERLPPNEHGAIESLPALFVFSGASLIAAPEPAATYVVGVG